VVALGALAAELAQHLARLRVLHALCRDLQPERVRELDDGADDRRVGDERAVDLEARYG
jgi:hypothetical protein